MTIYKAGITGTGHALPEGVITNADLEKMVETSDEWITSRTGIKERRQARLDESTSTFAIRAAQQAMEMAKIEPEDVDLLICATVCPDMALPSTSCLIQAELGAKNAAAFDLVAACSGFLYSLTIANQFIRAGVYKHCLLIGAELLTRFVDYTDRGTCILFGDGAGAVVVSRLPESTNGRGIISAKILSDGAQAWMLNIPGGGTKHGTSHESIDERLHFIKMRGNELFKVAVRAMSDISKQVLDESGIAPGEIDLFIPHQANQRITDAVADRLNVASEKIYANIARVGNTSSASIPIALDECVREGRLKEGDVVMMSAFGAGVTSGSAIMKW